MASLLSPPPAIPPPTALALSQKAPRILARAPASGLPWPLSLLLSRETPESWAVHENLLLAALRTGDEASAAQLLARLEARFGAHNERIAALRGVCDEATARSPADLERVFAGYEAALRDDPANVAVRKRRVAVLLQLGRLPDALTALTVLLHNSPTDVEAWAEASLLYAAAAAWGQAVYCADEVLLLAPTSWAAHAHAATLRYLAAAAAAAGPSPTDLALALKHFCRAAELNDAYLRAFYGIKLVAARLLALDPPASRRRPDDDPDDVPLPAPATLRALDELATRKLAELVRSAAPGLDPADIAAARDLLARSSA